MENPKTDHLTESQNPISKALDMHSVRDILKIINDEDQKVAPAVRNVLGDIERAVERFVATYRNNGRIIYVGAGTSGRLGVMDAAECPPTFSTPPDQVQAVLAGGQQALFQADEGQEDDYDAGWANIEDQLAATGSDLVIGITASGETPFVLGGLDAARHLGAGTVGLCNNPRGRLAQQVEVAILPVVGPEVIAGSTRLKAGTAQKMVLNMISTTAMVKLGKIYDNRMIDVKVTNAKLRSRARDILQSLTHEPLDTIDRTLEDAQYEVKPALMMLKASITYDEAHSLLQKHGGHARAALRELGLEV